MSIDFVLRLQLDDLQIELKNAPAFEEESADNVGSYDVFHQLGEVVYNVSQHALTVSQDDVPIRSCLLVADGDASGIHKRSALIHDGRCIVAVGPYVAAVALPTLELNWATQSDPATCFGVYHSRKHNCLLSHGELDIARLTFDGQIVWRAGGADIFTNGFTLHDDIIRVLDFYDREYIIDIQTGRVIG